MRELSGLEIALNEYREKFGQNYPLVIVSQMEESKIIAEIRKCIKSSQKAQEPAYDEGMVY